MCFTNTLTAHPVNGGNSSLHTWHVSIFLFLLFLEMISHGHVFTHTSYEVYNFCPSPIVIWTVNTLRLVSILSKTRIMHTELVKLFYTRGDYEGKNIKLCFGDRFPNDMPPNLGLNPFLKQHFLLWLVFIYFFDFTVQMLLVYCLILSVYRRKLE